MINLTSSQQLSILFFGGTITQKVKQVCIDSEGLPILIKSGQKQGEMKTKLVDERIKIKGFGLNGINFSIKGKNGFHSVDEEVLLKLSLCSHLQAAQLAQDLISLRKLQKKITAYYESVKMLIFPDKCIHPQFQHVATDTGRLSCKTPNVQNVPVDDTDVKKHFISRYQNGKLVSADYSSLEPRCEAQLSEDKHLLRDIIQNIDPHTKNLSLSLRQSYDIVSASVEDGSLVDARRKIKGFTFAVQYGAGNKKIAESSGLALEEVEDLRYQRKLEYPQLHRYYDWLQEEVNKFGFYTDPWGRRYQFKKYPAKYQWQFDKGIVESYLSTEVQNYRTQGFATGTIVPVMIGKFWRDKALYNKDKYLMINTVHDSLLLDCNEEFLFDACCDVKLLEEIDKVSKIRYNYEWIVPIKIDISY